MGLSDYNQLKQELLNQKMEEISWMKHKEMKR